MLFTESFITDNGVTLLARAAAEEGKIIWTQAATSSLDTSDYTTAQMNALTTSSFGTKTSSGAVTNAIVNDSQDSVAIYSELTNEHYSGDAKLFGAWAKIEGDENDVLVVVARCGSGVTPTYINSASDGAVKAFVDFTLTITASQAQSIQVSESYYATAAALESEQAARQALAARTVTTHKSGDPTTGDNQTVLGAKRFADSVECEHIINKYAREQDGSGIITKGFYDSEEGLRIGFHDPNVAQDSHAWNAYLQILSAGTPDGDSLLSNNSVSLISCDDNNDTNCYVRASNGDGEPNISLFTSFKNIDDTVTQKVSIGWDTTQLKASSSVSNAVVNSAEFYLTPTKAEMAASDEHNTKLADIYAETTTIEVGGTTYPCGYIKITASGGVNDNGFIEFSSNSDGYPKIELFCSENDMHSYDTSIQIEGAGVKILTDCSVYIKANVGVNIDCPMTTKGITIGGDIVPSNSSRKIGTSSAPLAEIHATSFTGNVTGNVTGNLTGNVTGNLTGKIPVVTDYSQPPVGSLLFIHITSISDFFGKKVGNTITPSQATLKVVKLSLDATGVISASSDTISTIIQTISEGTYTLLTAFGLLNTGDTAIALAMRTS